MSEAESDGGKPASKKRKASRACDRCNVQHQPCDNAEPKCSVCERAGTECTYNRPVRKRGPRTGYTAQYGERLWGLLLKAKPELEDLVLRAIADGTYGHTGVSNADYFRNNDHQSELVGHFNESRLGRFVQTGELPDLPPLGNGPIQMPLAVPFPAALGPNTGDPTSPEGSRSRRSTTSVTSKSLANPNLHGAPQNPGDIYTLSDEFRKRKSLSNTPVIHHNDVVSAQPASQSAQWNDLAAPVNNTGSPSFAFNAHGINNGYNALSRPHEQNLRLHEIADTGPMTSVPQGLGLPFAGQNITGTHSDGQNTDFDFPDIDQWYSSVPSDTLLNLGFTGGEAMERDFFELCENPDPVESMGVSPTVQNDDEEAVWRRLVMRGRFV